MPSGTDLLGDAIRAARMKKGYTQEVFAEMLDITPVHLANIEGSRRKPSVPLLFRMMELLNLSVDALVFPGKTEETILHTDGLSPQAVDVLVRLIDVMKQETPPCSNV